MVVLTNNDEQTVAVGGTVVFDSIISSGCNCGNRNGLSTSSVEIRNGNYLVSFSGNVGGATAATPVQLSIALDGVPVPASSMISVPAAVGDLNNVSKTIGISEGSCRCNCNTVRVTVTNTGTAPVTIGANPSLTVARLCH